MATESEVMDCTGSDPTPIRIKHGDPLDVTWTVSIDGSAVSFTGSTLTAAVRAVESTASAAKGTTTLTSPAASKLRILNSNHGLGPGRYWWAAKAVLSDGTILRGQGPLFVEPAGV